MTTSTKSKQIYEEKVKAQLKKMNAQIDELKAKGKKAQANASIEYHNQLEQLYTKRDAAQRKLEEIQKAGEEAWSELQAGFEQAWNDLSTAFEKAAAKLQ
ncbi:MAG: hypothetical protein F6K31_26795 [Symploca sp. SIO2G7]|nr:hypothetical protein [Symploca sp. SIO2G7]